MSFYRNWIPQENYYYAVENTNFEPNPERRDGSYGKYAGIDDKMEDLHYYMQVIKFGMEELLGMRHKKFELIKLLEKKGVTLVKKYDQEIPKTFLKDILEYLDISESYFWKVIEKHRNPNIWEKSLDGKWKLKVEIKLMRIISRLDIKGHNLIKGVKFEGLRVLGCPIKSANFIIEKE